MSNPTSAARIYGLAEELRRPVAQRLIPCHRAEAAIFVAAFGKLDADPVAVAEAAMRILHLPARQA